jgi:hypothetical protein
MKINKRVLWFLFTFSLNTLGHAGFNSASRGTSSGQFLKMGAGARATAMGEAYSAVADEASALYWNPAGLTQISNGSLTLMHSAYLESTFYDYAAYGQNLGTLGAFGIGGQFLSAGSITQTDTSGNDTGSFNPNDMALSLGYAHELWGGSVGVSGKLIRSTIIDTAQTQALDIGFLSPWLFHERLKLSMTATNLGGQLKYDQESADLPRTYRVGSRLKISDPWFISLDGVAPNDNQPYMAVGTEYTMKSSQDLSLAFRAGLNSRDTQDLSGFTSFSFGMGVNFHDFSLDYAFLPLGTLGNSNQFSLSYRWGKGEKKAHPQQKDKRFETGQSMQELFRQKFQEAPSPEVKARTLESAPQTATAEFLGSGEFK